MALDANGHLLETTVSKHLNSGCRVNCNFQSHRGFRWAGAREVGAGQRHTQVEVASDAACASRRGRVPPLPRFAPPFPEYSRTVAVSVQRPVPPGTSGYLLRVHAPS